MPSQIDYIKKSLKNVGFDTILIFTMLAIVGHLTINFWGRFSLQNEVSKMKNSLHSLKDTITDIGRAYDGLHTELKDLIKTVDNKHLVPPSKHKRDANDRCKTEPSPEHRNLHDIQVQTVVTDTMRNSPRVLTYIDKQSGHDGHEHKSTSPINKNAATNTKNPPKSVGIFSDLSKVELERAPLDNLIHLHTCNHIGSYRNYERCKKFCQRETSET